MNLKDLLNFEGTSIGLEKDKVYLIKVKKTVPMSIVDELSKLLGDLGIYGIIAHVDNVDDITIDTLDSSMLKKEKAK